jgi:hypothetical protein
VCRGSAHTTYQHKQYRVTSKFRRGSAHTPCLLQLSSSSSSSSSSPSSSSSCGWWCYTCHTHTSFSTSRQHQHEFLSWPPHNVHMLSMSGHTGTFDRVYDPEGGPPTTCSNIAVYHLGLKSRSCSPCSAFSMDPACPLRILDLQSVFSVQHGPGVPIEHFRPHC